MMNEQHKPRTRVKKDGVITGHPCFNKEAAGKYGRIHLPVAPKCNISCNYCNRKFDCANESRPGVTAKVMKPEEALEHFEKTRKIMPYINTIGIAGPGDALANADRTFQTLDQLKSKYPEVHLCLSTNGLLLPEHARQIGDLKITHVTVTVNAAREETAAKIYRRVTKEGVTYRSLEGAALLLENQYRGIEKLISRGTIVKVNFIYIPGVNDHELDDVIERMSALGVDLFNVMPFIPVEKTPFAPLNAPDEYEIFEAQQKVLRHKSIDLMSHCSQCRSDAAGMLGEGCHDEAGGLHSAKIS